MRRITFKGIGRAGKTVGSDLENVAKKVGKKVSDSVEGLVPPVVKDSVEKAKGFVKEKTKGAREYGKKLLDEASEGEDRIERLAREAKAKGKNVTVSERKDGRYHKIKDITYEDAKGKPKIGERSLDKGQVAKDAATGAALAGLGVGAVKANEKISETLGEAGAEDMVTQIKRKMREGKELTQSEKRLLRLMEA